MSTNTPQDTFDALSSELTECEIIEMLVDRAMKRLDFDAANPDVGMGMFVFTAINMAADDIRKEATVWRRKVYISDSAKKKAAEIVREKRGR